MGVGLLGPLTVNGDPSAVGPRDRVVLAALAVHRGESVSVEALSAALWGDHLPASAHKVVQGCVARLRKVLGPQAIETVPRGYVLALPPDRLDVAEFERLVSRGRELLSLGEADRAAYLIDQALDLWRGEPFVDLDGWDPGRSEAERLTEIRLDAEELRVEGSMRAGHVREVLAEAHRLTTAAPLRERRWAQLALAQYQVGRQADALATVRSARRVLAKELGLDPGPELVELEQAILRQDPGLAAVSGGPEPAAHCPYKGLVPYDVDDSDGFFGRDADVSECLRRIGDDGVVVVIGPSGSGKSSLLRAGLVAALRREGKRVVVVTPGPHPMDALDGDLGSGRTPTLVVDQCEEAVTLCDDPQERARFFAALAEHAERGPLVVAMRADRLGEMPSYPAFARLVERGLFLLRRMAEEDLRAAIEGPAHQAGLLVEPGLVDLLLRDIENEPGALPLLSHALRQTWARREGRTLTVTGYTATGGIRGAVAQTAESVYENAAPEQRPLLRDLLLRLVTPSPEGEPVRNRLPRRAVTGDPEHEQVVEELVRARLVTSDEDVVELAHEALVRVWPRLRGWLEEDVEGQRIRRQVAVAAEEWENLGRPDSELYRGPRLSRALEWRERGHPALNLTEAAFLDAGQAAVEAEHRAAEERAHHQMRVNRRLRALVAVVALLAVVSVSGGLLARNQASRADLQAARADLQADVARSHELAAFSTREVDDDPTLAKLLAIASATVANPALESTSALHRALDADKAVARYAWTAEAPMFQLFTDIDRSGRRMVASAMSNYVEVVDPFTGDRLWSRTLDPEEGAPGGASNTMEFSLAQITDDGESVVAGLQRWRPRAHSGGIVIWDAGTGDLVRRIDTGPCGGVLMSLAEPYALVRTLARHDENACYWSPQDEHVELVDLGSGTREPIVRHPPDVHNDWGAAISGDRRYLVVDDPAAALAGDVVVRDLRTGARSTFDTSGRQDNPGVRALNHDGSLLLYGDGPAQVWDVARGRLVATFDGRAESGFGEFERSGTAVYSSGKDGVLRRWDARTGRELASYSGVGFGSVTVSGADRVLAANLRQGEAVLVDFSSAGELGQVRTCPGEALEDRLAVGGRIAVLPVRCHDDDQATTYAVSVDDLDTRYTLPGHQADALAVSPDGTRFVRQEGRVSTRGSLTVHDIRSGETLLTLQGRPLCAWTPGLTPPRARGCQETPELPFGSRHEVVRWSPDGSMIAASTGSLMTVWDADDGHVLFVEDPPPGHDPSSPVINAVFTPDSRRLLVNSYFAGFRAISTEDWNVLERSNLPGTDDRPPSFLDFAPDGRTLLGLGGFGFPSNAGRLEWITADSETDTYAHLRSLEPIHEGALVTAAISADGSRVATGSADGIVKVWDSVSGDLLDQIPVRDSAVHGVAFVDHEHLVVARAGGDLLLVTTDPEELVEVARQSLTRGFTAAECEQFTFDDHCPTLAELTFPSSS